MMEDLRCLLIKGGFFFLGLPFAQEDCVVFNLHRIYGPVRRAMLFRKWKVRGIYGDSWKKKRKCQFAQPMTVLESP